MSKREREIALQSATLTRQRRRLQLRQQALRHDVRTLCKQPSTLACAALAGFALARMGPLAHAVMQTSTADGRSFAILQALCYQLLRSSRSFRNTVHGSGSAGRSGKD